MQPNSGRRRNVYEQIHHSGPGMRNVLQNVHSNNHNNRGIAQPIPLPRFAIPPPWQLNSTAHRNQAHHQRSNAQDAQHYRYRSDSDSLKCHNAADGDFDSFPIGQKLNPHDIHIWLPTVALLKQLNSESITDSFLLLIISVLFESRVDLIHEMIKWILTDDKVADLHAMLKQHTLHIPPIQKAPQQNNTHCIYDHHACSYFDKLSDLSIFNIFSYLRKQDVNRLKNTSTRLALCALTEMQKYKIGSFNMMEFIRCKEYKDLVKCYKIKHSQTIKYNRYKADMKCETMLEIWQNAYKIPMKNMFLLRINHNHNLSALQTWNSNECPLFSSNECVKSRLEKSGTVSNNKNQMFLVMDNRYITHMSIPSEHIPEKFEYQPDFTAGMVLLYYFNIKEQTMQFMKFVLASPFDDVTKLCKFIEHDKYIQDMAFDNDDLMVLNEMKRFNTNHPLFRIYNASYAISNNNGNNDDGSVNAPMILEHTVSGTSSPALLIPGVSQFEVFIFSINNEHSFFDEHFFDRMAQNYMIRSKTVFFYDPNQYLTRTNTPSRVYCMEYFNPDIPLEACIEYFTHLGSNEIMDKIMDEIKSNEIIDEIKELKHFRVALPEKENMENIRAKIAQKMACIVPAKYIEIHDIIWNDEIRVIWTIQSPELDHRNEVIHRSPFDTKQAYCVEIYSPIESRDIEHCLPVPLCSITVRLPLVFQVRSLLEHIYKLSRGLYRQKLEDVVPFLDQTKDSQFQRDEHKNNSENEKKYIILLSTDQEANQVLENCLGMNATVRFEIRNSGVLTQKIKLFIINEQYSIMHQCIQKYDPFVAKPLVVRFKFSMNGGDNTIGRPYVVFINETTKARDVTDLFIRKENNVKYVKCQFLSTIVRNFSRNKQELCTKRIGLDQRILGYKGSLHSILLVTLYFHSNSDVDVVKPTKRRSFQLGVEM